MTAISAPSPLAQGDTPEPTALLSRHPGARSIVAVLGVLAVTCFAIALPTLGRSSASQIGLLATASPLYALSIVLVAVAFVIALRARLFAAATASALGALLIERLPSVLGTDAPLYAWTYKHIGVVDYIQTHHVVDKTIDVYQGWPGMFAVTAWFSDVTGVSPQTLAHLFTPLLHIGIFVLVFAFARARELERMSALMAAFVVETLNWIGQDYFSPQAVAFFLALGFLVLIAPDKLSNRRALLAFVVYCAITVSHQLTPYWLLAIVVILALTKRLRPWWLPVLMVAVTVGMLAYNWQTVSQYVLFSADPVSNAQSSTTTVGVFGQRVTSLLMRAVTVVFYLLAATGVIWRWRTGRPWWSTAVIAFSSFAILAGQSYGGEAIYRVFLYSLPGCALLVAPLLDRLITGRVPFSALASVGLVAVVAAAAQGTFGPWQADRVPASDVAASRRLLDSAPTSAYLTPAAPSWPNNMTARYADFGGQSTGDSDASGTTLVSQARLTGSQLSSDASYRQIVRTVQKRRGGPTYLFISEQMARYSWYFGYLPLHALEHLTDHLRADPRWRVFDDGDGYIVFETTAAMYQAQR